MTTGQLCNMKAATKHPLALWSHIAWDTSRLGCNFRQITLISGNTRATILWSLGSFFRSRIFTWSKLASVVFVTSGDDPMANGESVALMLQSWSASRWTRTPKCALPDHQQVSTSSATRRLRDVKSSNYWRFSSVPGRKFWKSPVPALSSVQDI